VEEKDMVVEGERVMISEIITEARMSLKTIAVV
jgi:hypothetical protein